MRDVLAIILGGGRGTRLFPLTHARSKPAVPIGGKYRLIDIPISSCLNSEIRRIYVLTQFNSASLNRHISQTYRLDGFSQGFVDIIAAEQTPDNHGWFQGTADAVRQARRHFESLDSEYYLILAGDHLYRMDYAELIESHTERHADITLAAQPVGTADATQMGIFRFDHSGQIVGFEEKPDRGPPVADRQLAAVRRDVPADAGRQALCRVDGHLRLLAPGAARGARARRHRLWQGDHSGGARQVSGERVPPPRLLGRCRNHRGLLRRQHHADASRCALPLPRSEAADLHQAAPPAAGTRLRRTGRALRAQRRLLAVGRRLSRLGDWRSGRRRPTRDHHALGADRHRLLRDRRRRGRAGAEAAPGHRQRRRHRPRDRRQERAHRRRVPAGQSSAACRKPTATAGTSEAASSWCPRGRQSSRAPWSKSTSLSGPVGDGP